MSTFILLKRGVKVDYFGLRRELSRTLRGMGSGSTYSIRLQQGRRDTSFLDTNSLCDENDDPKSKDWIRR